MIKLGDQKITTMYAGAQKIAKAYVGEAKLFGEDVSPSRLPEGYTEVEYISNPNGAYIQDFNYANGKKLFNNPFLNLKGELVVKLPSVSKESYLFGNYYWRKTYTNELNPRMSGSTNQLTINKDNTIQIQPSGGLYSNYKLTYTPNTIATIIYDIPKLLFSVDGNQAEMKATSTAIKTSSYSFCIFARRYLYCQTTSSSCTPTGTADGMVDMTLYSFKIYASTAESTGDLVADYVPCINQEGKAGLYDIVNQAFHGSKNENEFTPGPAV